MASLRQAEPDWDIYLLTGADGPLVANSQALGVQTIVVPFPALLAKLGSFRNSLAQLAFASAPVLPVLFLYWWRLGKVIRAISPDVIHSNGFKMHLLAAWLPQRAAIVWHLHDFLSHSRIRSWALRLSSLRCTGAIAVSQSVANDALQVLASSVAVEIVLNAVDLARFHPRGALAPFGRTSSPTVRIGLIATFARWKGHEVFLKAMAHPSILALDIHAYVVGGPIYETSGSQYSRPELDTLVEELGLSNRTTFTGFLENSASAMRALDIVVHASTLPEPFGLAIAEAMACGRPVIATNQGGAAEILDHAHSGVAIPPGDSDALAAAICQLYHDGIARWKMGRAARQQAELRFNRDRLGPSLASFYREVLGPCEFSTSTAAISTAA